MGGAIIAGLQGPDVRVEGGIAVTNRTEVKAAALRAHDVESWALETDPDAHRVALRGARLVLVAVKPALVPPLLEEVSDLLEPDAVVVSVATGVTTATMEGLVANPVARAMPNTPALVRRGVTGLAAGSRISAPDFALVGALFGTIGEVVEVPEAQIDALTTISGSGPAYVFFLIERLTEAARGLGFDDAQARLLVEQTFLGASELLAASDADPAELRRRVTSPNGTTERAIAVLDAADLDALFERATAAALARAEEMAAGR
jgi:pyrroline-5-carboxylate reductase